MKTTDNRFIPGEFLFDVAGGAYLIVDYDHFVDSFGVLFRFADYGSFSKTSVYAESVVIETGKPQLWKNFGEGTIVARGKSLCVRAGGRGDNFFEILDHDKTAFAPWEEDFCGRMLVEPLEVRLKSKDYKYVWKPKYAIRGIGEADLARPRKEVNPRPDMQS
jgi:hypothetical protein